MIEARVNQIRSQIEGVISQKEVVTRLSPKEIVQAIPVDRSALSSLIFRQAVADTPERHAFIEEMVDHWTSGAFDMVPNGYLARGQMAGFTVEELDGLQDFAWEARNLALSTLASRKQNLERRSKQIHRIAGSASDYDREKLQERVAKLAGGVAVIRVGGMTEVEVKERKDRVDDALNATRAAIQEGIVVGGGVALIQAAKVLDKLEGANADQNFGIRIVRRALEAPLRQIAENAGEDGSVVVSRVRDADEASFGFNAQTGEFGDLFKFGVIDPAKVVRTALEDAASVAGLLITVEAMVADIPETRRNDGKNDQGRLGGAM